MQQQLLQPPLRALHLHTSSHRHDLHADIRTFPHRVKISGLLFQVTQDMVVFVRGALSFTQRVKRESGENPELPRSGKQVRKPKMTLEPSAPGSPASRVEPAQSEDLPRISLLAPPRGDEVVVACPFPCAWGASTVS